MSPFCLRNVKYFNQIKACIPYFSQEENLILTLYIYIFTIWKIVEILQNLTSAKDALYTHGYFINKSIFFEIQRVLLF